MNLAAQLQFTTYDSIHREFSSIFLELQEFQGKMNVGHQVLRLIACTRHS